MTKKRLFDEIYEKANKQKDECIWGRKPDKLTIKSVKYIKGEDILDLGVGDGKDAVYLSKKGFSVLGIDYSKLGISRLKKNAKKSNVKVKTKIIDIKNFVSTKKYSAIFSLDTLNFLKRGDIKNITKKMKDHTLDGGINVIRVVNVNDPGFKESRYKKSYFKKNELKEFYKDWKIIHYKENISEPEKHGKDDEWHRQGFSEIISMKK